MGADEAFLGRLGPSLLALLPRVDERARRLVLGMAAVAAGEGGTGAVAALTGMAPQTVAKGAAELESGQDPPPGRVRRPGGGRKRLTETDPGLLAALEALVKDAMRGDPESPLVWTTRSAEHLAGELTAQGHRCSDSTVLAGDGARRVHPAVELPGAGGAAAPGAGRAVPVHRRAGQGAPGGGAAGDQRGFQEEGAGRELRAGRPRMGAAGELAQVRSHDFPDKDGRHAIPYGIYDEQASAGFVNVGTDGNTAALAVESIRRWWDLAGKDAYPDAARLLVTCDSGGSNGSANRAWKAGLAQLAQETGLEITVCHFPPGTSKWNKIEHRLFCQISLAWRGRPLTSYDVIITTIGAVTTKTGLDVRAVLDENKYPTGLKISDAQMKDIEDRCLARHEFHGEWNYALLPVPRPAPDPEPGPGAGRPARPGPARPGTPRDHRHVPRRVRRPRRQPGNPPGRRPRAAPLHQPRRSPPPRQPPRPRPAHPPGPPAGRRLPLPPRHDLPRDRRTPRDRPLRHQHRHPPDRRHPRHRRRSSHPAPSSSAPSTACANTPPATASQPAIHQMTR